MRSSQKVITIATGKKIYVDMAANLARSFLWWHKNSEIKFQLITDQLRFIPADLINKIEVISIKPGEFGEGFSPKLHLDLLISQGQTLFIDSDCLIFGNLEGIFDRFKGHGVSVIGGFISKGAWYGDVMKICNKFSIPHYPKFNGGIYYVEKGIIATKIYEKARELEKQYDQIGFERFRGHPADEVLMAVAMQLYGQGPIPDDGTILSDPQCCQGKYSIDLIDGKACLYNPPFPNKLNQNWYPHSNVSPLVVHFLGHYTQHYPYKREAFRVKRALEGKKQEIINITGRIKIQFPMVLIKFLKDILRPLFRFIIGTRKIKPSERI